MATTRYGVSGPMAAYPGFTNKGAGAPRRLLPLMGAGAWLLWLLGGW
jgi:hypothetical protein